MVSSTFRLFIALLFTIVFGLSSNSDNFKNHDPNLEFKTASALDTFNAFDGPLGKMVVVPYKDDLDLDKIEEFDSKDDIQSPFMTRFGIIIYPNRIIAAGVNSYFTGLEEKARLEDNFNSTNGSFKLNSTDGFFLLTI